MATKYKSKTDVRYLQDILSPVTELVSINDFHAKHGPMETKFLDSLAQHLLTNHNIYVYHKTAALSIQRQAGNQSLLRQVEDVILQLR